MSLRTLGRFASTIASNPLITAQIDFPTYLVFTFPSTPRPISFQEVYGHYLEARAETIQDEMKLFTLKVNLQSKTSIDDEALAKDEFFARNLEHEHLQKRIRHCELETQVLSAELAASSQRVAEARKKLERTGSTGFNVDEQNGVAFCADVSPSHFTSKFPVPGVFNNPSVIGSACSEFSSKYSFPFLYQPPALRTSYDDIDVHPPLADEEESLD